LTNDQKSNFQLTHQIFLPRTSNFQATKKETAENSDVGAEEKGEASERERERTTEATGSS
jgi:hypothetical protein